MDGAYKDRKIAFHAGNEGSSLAEVHAVTTIGLSSYWLWQSLHTRAPRLSSTFAVQYATFVLPLLLATTLLSSYAVSEVVVLLLLVSEAGSTRCHEPFIVVYRAHMMIITVICILAVDFPIFPRAFGKCESFGTSLMDLGVGSFVFSLGLVSGRPNDRSKQESSFLSALSKSASILILAALRVVAVKGVEYPEQTQEYGVHWNFFVTLGLLPMLRSIFERAWPRSSHAWVGCSISIAHQTALRLGLADWAQHTPRNNLLTANKEGVTSLAGYVAIFFFALDAGSCVLPPKGGAMDGQSSASHRRKVLGLRCAAYALAFGLFHFVFDMSVSRQLANLSYIAWTCAFNSASLLGYSWIAGDRSTELAPALLTAFNSNGLPIFLLANMLTGAVNLGIATMDAGQFAALGFLVSYSGAIAGAAWLLKDRRLRF